MNRSTTGKLPDPGRPPGTGKDAGRPNKRRKIAVACDECRVRKTRCDGAQPGLIPDLTSDLLFPVVCGPCTKKADPGVQCVYTGKQKLDVKNLESRLKAFARPPRTPASVGHESSGHSQEPTFSYSPVSSSGAPVATQFTSSSVPDNYHRLSSCIPANTSAGDNSPSASAYRSPSGRNAGYVSGLAQTRQRADGVNAMMGAVEEERPTQGFFGSSSAASFMHQIKMAVDRRVTSPHRRTSDTILGVSHAPGLMSTASERHFNIQNYVLPPRKTADSLMGVYWSFVFPLYPLVDGIGLRAEYEKVWTGEPLENDESMLMCTLNVIFALACQLADFIPPEEREASADAFFSRAKDLLQFNLWDTGSAALIQCLLLMAQYLQSTDSAHQCWIVTGLAIRNAQSLGLHLPQTITRLPSPQEQQLARKIWHGCVLMDRYGGLYSLDLQCLTLSRVISMTFGRPAMISKASCESVPLPATVDEEYIPTASGIEATQPADQPSVMAFYAKSLELYEIMNDILLSLYQPVPDESPEDMYDLYFNKETSQGERTIFELDRALSKWSQSLPSHLRGNSPAGPTDVVFYHQSVVLRARFLHVRMLLFRPILSRYCAARDITVPDSLVSPSDSFPQRIAWQCSAICVKVAQEVIELIYGNIPADGSSGPLPAWWYNILYVYTAATVLIAGYLCPTVLDEVTEGAITRSWNCALEILRKYQSYSTSARRCVAALEILYERVVSERPLFHEPSASDQQQSTASNAVNDMSLGEGINAMFMEGFDWPDFQDMSWLNSVPSSLH
ncbi:C6 transcription factor [Aspergillus pseudonomiae]|nr:C6 transcription factor [Aspergillus pseudonomiae]